MPPASASSNPCRDAQCVHLRLSRQRGGGGRRRRATVERGAWRCSPNEGDGVVLRSAGGEPARALLIAGQPLREPIAQYGPFVMNTRQQLVEAVEDFNSGRLR